MTADDRLQMDLRVQKSIGYAKPSPDLYFVMAYSIRKIQYTMLCEHQKKQPMIPESKLKKKPHLKP